MKPPVIQSATTAISSQLELVPCLLGDLQFETKVGCLSVISALQSTHDKQQTQL